MLSISSKKIMQGEASRALQAMMENVRQLWGDGPESKHVPEARQADSEHIKVTADNPEVTATASSPLRASEGGAVPDHDIGQEPAGGRQPAVAVKGQGQAGTIFAAKGTGNRRCPCSFS